MLENPIISVSNLSKRFGAVRAVDEISFEIAAGSVTALLGANGAGKTTTIAMLLGLVVPSAGKISIFGIDMLKNRYRALARMNFSSPYIDLPQRLSVKQNLAVYARLYGIAAIDERLSTLAKDLQISEFIDRPYGTLSAGQRTRVMLAKALLNEPELLLLDEPTASLDPDSADWIRRYLSDYRKHTGAAILLASHNMQEVERLCDYVLMMEHGRITDTGTPKRLIEAYGRDSLEEVFLAVARRTPEKQVD
ncbi:MAG TPA: ABC transporter [Rhodospirillaceae bacterium]|nr:ABC transporter [Rhodospirillaceae bacterium]HAA92174.1 ABC transporter [Rhodospirillaceae bacterium]HAT34437.1 ABC transporter [Rhodospirillaceae bacterium]|tara:strand:+ start:326 stop:1075 length:750 start_codon:yes stop_codon:yes gene_type:complete